MILKEVKSSPDKYSRLGLSLDKIFIRSSVEGLYNQLEMKNFIKEQNKALNTFDEYFITYALINF